MIRTIAVEGYRSLRHLVVGLGTLTVVTGPNGSGKTSVYRALRLLADLTRDGALSSLAREGGLRSALHAGPWTGERVSLRLGFADDDLSYAVDLGMPQPPTPFPLDPEVKSEVVWAGPHLRAGAVLADRKGPRVRIRDRDGELVVAPWQVRAHESLVATLADPAEAPELYAIREQARRWRFYDHVRTDADAPARRPGVATFTPVLAADGADLAAALLTIQRVGVAQTLDSAVDAAFPGCTLQVGEDADGGCRLTLDQPGVRRPLGVAELSDGTVRFLLLAAALLSPRPPALLVLNEPEASLHPSLMPALAALVADAATRSQVVVVTHSGELVRALRADADLLELHKDGGATGVVGSLAFEGPEWSWPRR
ncbi:AAA family ATPase [Actinotalea sp. Marseille-Q4924]|uniref:AAA family ATPase n=1 Tax=Actinotalea sp. Marseille-Q4924 TaxID=2866571 RepID=UPI001CE3FFC4|nr:AAA family ATPase [Actinotalea sp. Marseille-Q4924]